MVAESEMAVELSLKSHGLSYKPILNKKEQQWFTLVSECEKNRAFLCPHQFSD